MLKEAILFVASTGVLIYLIAPSGEPPEAEPVEQTEPLVATSPVQNMNDGWGSDGSGDDGWGDEDEAVDENFTFGDPMIVLDRQDDDRDEAKTSSSSQPSGNGAGQPGNINNPIMLTPKDLPNPEPQ
ncbi:hypothetical protein [Parasphingorhabdus sp.]|uniref:hypothetical protein n=1 Tax=Parasphingorhabdus sp. TaxID=2709688 RepID=UPI00359439AE